MSNTKVEKILVIGDSISANLHLKTIETATKAEVRFVKAYSSIFKNSESPANYAPRYPTKNFNDIIPSELKKEKVDTLIVQSGSVDITNLKTEASDSKEYLEYFEQKTKVSANNLFQAVTNAATKHPELKKIIIMKQIPRHDANTSNPPGLKPFLSKIFNETLDLLWTDCSLKNKLVIGNHNLHCSRAIFEARYRNIQSNRLDGVHLYGPSGMKSYTASVINIMSAAQLVKATPPKYYDEYNHMKCNQASYQTNQQYRT